MQNKPVQKTRNSFPLDAAVFSTSNTTLEKPWTNMAHPSNIKS